MKLPFIARPAALLLTFVSEVVVLHLPLGCDSTNRAEKGGMGNRSVWRIVLAVVGLLRQG